MNVGVSSPLRVSAGGERLGRAKGPGQVALSLPVPGMEGNTREGDGGIRMRNEFDE